MFGAFIHEPHTLFPVYFCIGIMGSYLTHTRLPIEPWMTESDIMWLKLEIWCEYVNTNVQSGINVEAFNKILFRMHCNGSCLRNLVIRKNWMRCSDIFISVFWIIVEVLRDLDVTGTEYYMAMKSQIFTLFVN